MQLRLKRANGQSHCYLSCDGVNLSIGSNVKLAPVPCAIPKWPLPDVVESRSVDAYLSLAGSN